MKWQPPPAPTPLRRTMTLEERRAKDPLLPPNPRDKLYAADVKLEEMPKAFDCALVEAVSDATKLSRGKARKVILRGEVSVNGEVVRDPDVRVKRTDIVACGSEGSVERR